MGTQQNHDFAIRSGVGTTVSWGNLSVPPSGWLNVRSPPCRSIAICSSHHRLDTIWRPGDRGVSACHDAGSRRSLRAPATAVAPEDVDDWRPADRSFRRLNGSRATAVVRPPPTAGEDLP